MQIPIRQAFELLEQPPLTCMRKIATSFALVFLTLASVQLSAQSAASVTLVKAERLLDPRTGNVLTPAFVLIEGDKVKQVGSSSQIGVPSGAKIIDLSRATVLPGLIDGHVHLTDASIGLQHQMLVEQIQGGKFVTVWPKELATGKSVWPFPGWK